MERGYVAIPDGNGSYGPRDQFKPIDKGPCWEVVFWGTFMTFYL